MTKQRIFGIGILVASLVAGFLAVQKVSAQQRDLGPLASVPGLARDEEGAKADDAIALWETFQIELGVASCMEKAGFEYEPELHYPDSALIGAAAKLGVDERYAIGEIAAISVTRNRQYAEALARNDLETYFVALWGESRSDMITLDETRAIPAGRGGDFATTGCKGRTWLEGPPIFTVRRIVGDQVVRTRLDSITTIEISCKGEGLEDVRHIPDLDALLASVDPSKIDPSVLEACSSVITEAAAKATTAAEVEVAAANQSLLAGHTARYEGMLDRVKEDSDFLDMLARHASASKLELEPGDADADDN